MNNDLVVIGGGPAGMMAAIAAAEQGTRVTLLEANEKVGKKLYITGKGRCNLTNLCSAQEFLQNVPCNPRFLTSCISAMDSQRLMQTVEEWGVPLKVERGNRVFPVSEKASDIIRAMQRRMSQVGVTTRTGDPCFGLIVQEGVLQGVMVQSGKLLCDAVILATGGLSYPATGSTGDGYQFAKETGHAIASPRASLVPLTTVEHWPRVLQGLSLKNVSLSARIGKKVLFDEMGEMLFTHFGISGPLALSLSAHLPESLQEVEVFLDTKPALRQEQVAARVLREMEAMQRKQFSSVLQTLMNHSMVPVFASIVGIEPDLPVHQITKAQRLVIANTLKKIPLHISARRSWEEAVITRGGIKVSAINPKTMESKLVKGLYFAGEIIDVDAYTGGFNLQIAFSTGYVAGRSAAHTKEDASC